MDLLSFFALDKMVASRSGSDLYTKAYVAEEGYLVLASGKESTRLIKEDEILIPGKHNVENYLAAALATEGYVSQEAFEHVAKTFKGVAHRIEFIRELDGVKYYNSSIDTSPNRTMNPAFVPRVRKVLVAPELPLPCSLISMPCILPSQPLYWTDRSPFSVTSCGLMFMTFFFIAYLLK